VSLHDPTSAFRSTPLAARARPLVLRVDLDRAAGNGPLGPAAVLEPWSEPDPALDRLGASSGLALALSLLEQRARTDARAAAPLVIAVGHCVRRGLPTAARASIASRAPLSGRLADGQVGGDLARRLVRVADALEIRGALHGGPGLVLAVEEDGTARLDARSELAGLAPRATFDRLRELEGPECAVLCIGPGGERALPFASLAASGDVPHFVGRGGLGAVLGRAGLKAIVVRAREVPLAPERELHRALASSPRLEARAAGGTLELFEGFAARGALDERAHGVAAELERSRVVRHGCTGCPTPCGWVFRAPQGREQGARFGATWSLGLRLGLARAEDALGLLARADDAGLDAKELGAGLALLRMARDRGTIAGGPFRPERAGYEAWIDELLAGVGEGARLERGAEALAVELDLTRELAELGPTPAAPEADLAAWLASAVAVRGPDPMRSFPFLAHDAGSAELLANAVAPLRLPRGAGDPRDPAGKGRLVWWHENLAAALDTAGFCTFSAAALLSDGALALERLAAWIEPVREDRASDGTAAQRLLALGEAVSHLARRIDERWRGQRVRAERSAALLALPGMLDEYSTLRGLDTKGELAPTAKARFDRGLSIAEFDRLATDASQPAERTEPSPTLPRTLGKVRLIASGLLREALGSAADLELELPSSVERVLSVACERQPAARAALFDGVRLRAAVYRKGVRLASGDVVRAGDCLDLTLVISGG
jgi:aldehyde:ferredoxin oxidoreductase